MYPQYVRKLFHWAKSKNRWKRRASAVSLIVPARKGLFHPEVFELAEMLLLDSEDMVQKGYGWMLKSASNFDEQSVFQFVMQHKATMPRTALRYAIEKMPQNLKDRAMKKP
jgi:3-methyladenine DNA glycosylase AlkD